MARVTLRVFGPQIRQAVVDWAKKHLVAAANIEADDHMTLDKITREVLDDDETHIDVFFDSEAS